MDKSNDSDLTLQRENPTNDHSEAYEFKALYRDDIMQILGMCRDDARALLRSEGFPATKIGNRYFVEAANLRKWFDTYAGREFLLRKKNPKPNRSSMRTKKFS